MRMLDVASERAVQSLQLYLTPEEAVDLRASLDRLLNDPEALEHEHLFSRNGGAEMSLSIVTPTKLREAGYTAIEPRLLNGSWGTVSGTG